MLPKPQETIIEAKHSWLDLELREFFRYRDLLYLLVHRDFVTSYKQTVLGPFWVILQALMGSAVFTVVFGKIAGLSTDGHPAFLFYLCGTLGWQFFGNVLGIGSNALQSNLALFSKVYFPRLIPPIGQAISALPNFLIQLIVLLLALSVYQYQTPETSTGPTVFSLLVPMLVLQSAMLALGVGFLISWASVKYRDLGRLGGLIAQFIMYASPVIYPISEIPENYQAYLAYNPLTFILESYRFLLLGKATGCTMEFAIPSVAITISLFFAGSVLYNKAQRTYIDYV